MLLLTEITRGSRFRLYAIGSNNQNPSHEFLAAVQADQPREWTKLMARLHRAAECGPPVSNPEQCRQLKGNRPDETVYEFKTHLLRLFWFYDEDRVILCTNGMMKGPRKEQDQAIAIARSWKAAYLAAKIQGQIKFLPQS